MPQMLIVADDLSGAADSGVACIGSGLNTLVIWGDADPRDHRDADVLSVDADTRRLTPSQASEQTAKLVHRYASGSDIVLFKKIDSTLRGHVGAELAATLEARRSQNATGRRVVAVLAPAFPAGGRTTVNGEQLVCGKPLRETEFHRHSELIEIVGTAGMRPVLLGLDLVRLGEDVLRDAMMQFAERADVLVCDAESDQDLSAIANASIALGRATVWAGSAGLAYPLPRAVGLVRSAPVIPPPNAKIFLSSRPTLFVIGSLSDVTRRQADQLAASDLISITVSTDTLLAGRLSPQWRRQAQQLEDVLDRGRDALVMTCAESPLDETDRFQIAEALATFLAHQAGKVGALVASGGETARSTLSAWGVTCLRLLGELEPGLPLSITENGSVHIPVITKAGGFGRPQALLDCRRFLRELDRTSPSMACQGKGLPAP